MNRTQQGGGIDLESVSLDSGDLEVAPDNVLSKIETDCGIVQNGKVVFVTKTKACRTEDIVGHVNDFANGDPRKPRKSVFDPTETSIGQLDNFVSSLSPTWSPAESTKTTLFPQISAADTLLYL